MTKIEKSRYCVIFSFFVLVSCQLYATNPTNFLIGAITQSNQQLKIGEQLWFKQHNPHWRFISQKGESWQFGVKSIPMSEFELKKTNYYLAQIHQPKSILLKEYGLLGLEIKESELINSMSLTSPLKILKLSLYSKMTQKNFIQFLIEFNKKDRIYSLNCYPDLEKSCQYLIELIQGVKQ